MAFCSQCGTRLDGDNVKFCSNCGARVELGQINNSTGYGTYAAENNSAQEVSVQNYSMKWFKFLIYFALFFGALLNCMNGINYLTGSIYFAQTNGQVTADMVYGAYGSTLKTVDMVYGIAMVAMGVFGIYTRFRLAKFKENGPKCLNLLNGLGIVLSILYILLLSGVVGVNDLVGSSDISTIGGSVVFFLLNYKYFAKRKELFIN